MNERSLFTRFCRVKNCNQFHKDSSAALIHQLHEEYYGINSNQRTMSIKQIRESGHMNKEIEKLLADKEKANKAGDEGKARLIRRQLRKLGYKRALAKGEVEAPKKEKPIAKSVTPKKVEKKIIKKPIKKVVEASDDEDTEV